MKKRLLILILVLFIAPLFACSNEVAREGVIFAFDTNIEIKIRANRDLVNKYYEDVCDIFFHYDALCDNYSNRDINNVFTINNSEGFIEVDKDLIDVINAALKAKEETSGHFDPLVGSIAQVYKDIIHGLRDYPDSDEINLMKDELKNSKIVIDGNKVKIEGNAMLDLGGIAKGYALSLVKEYLLENNIHYYLINAGSSSIAMGEKNGGYFAVGLMYSSGAIYIKNGDMGCASVSNQQTFIGEKRIHHIINPLKCEPAEEFFAVYLIGRDSKMIDAYATAFMSMTLDEIESICLKNDIEYIIYDNDMKAYSSTEDSYYEFG